MRHDDPLVFALNGAHELGHSVAAALGLPLTDYEFVQFDDGEHKTRAIGDVQSRDAYVVESLFDDAQESVHDKLCRLLFFLGSLRDASAARLTAVIPYLCYARVDRKTEPNDPVTNRYVATFIEAMGVDHVVTLEVHNVAAFQNAYRCRTHHLEARPLFVDYFAPRLGSVEPLVLSPDVGGIKRAEAFREALSDALGKPVASGFMEKQRTNEHVTGEHVVGDVQSRTVVIFDDMICSGRTLARAVNACKTGGAACIYAAATHGVFTPGAADVLNDPAIEATVVTDSIPVARTRPEMHVNSLVVLPAAESLADAIRRIHEGTVATVP